MGGIYNTVNMLRTMLLLAVLASWGCATTSKAPAVRDQEAKNFHIKPESGGVIYLYRPKKVYASAVQFPVRINDKVAGGTGPGTFFRWELPKGTYRVFSQTSESSAVIEIEVKAQETYFIRQSIRPGVGDVRVRFEEVSVAKGQEEVSRCKLLQSAY